MHTVQTGAIGLQVIKSVVASSNVKAS